MSALRGRPREAGDKWRDTAGGERRDHRDRAAAPGQDRARAEHVLERIQPELDGRRARVDVRRLAGRPEQDLERGSLRRRVVEQPPEGRGRSRRWYWPGARRIDTFAWRLDGQHGFCSRGDPDLKPFTLDGRLGGRAEERTRPRLVASACTRALPRELLGAGRQRSTTPRPRSSVGGMIPRAQRLRKPAVGAGQDGGQRSAAPPGVQRGAAEPCPSGGLARRCAR